MFKKLMDGMMENIVVLSVSTVLAFGVTRYGIKKIVDYQYKTAQTWQEQNEATELEIKYMDFFYPKRSIPYDQRITSETLKPGSYGICIGYTGYNPSSEHPDFAPEPDIFGFQKIMFVRDDGSVVSQLPGKERIKHNLPRYRVMDNEDLEKHYYKKCGDIMYFMDKHYDL